MTYRLLDLFSGIGGFSLGLERSGAFKTVAFCEIEPFCRRVLAKHWPGVPCYDDVRTLTADRLRADGIAVDFVSAGFPCQDASIANIGGQGVHGARTGLFSEAVRLAGEFDAGLLLENVTGLFDRGFGDVLRELARSGYDAEWRVVSARAAGADHERKRILVLAYPRSAGWKRLEPNNSVLGSAAAALAQYGDEAFGDWRSLVSGERALRSVDGVSLAMERRRLHGVGNSVTPAVVTPVGRAIAQAEAA